MRRPARRGASRALALACIGAAAATLAPIAACAAAAAPASAAGSGSAKRPNIVFILTDDLSWDLVQYMPHVVEMRRRGVTFTNYYVTDSLCCPSRSSIFTGRFPHDTGIFRNTGADGGYLPFRNRGLEKTTFATSLLAAGYKTAMMGKYLNGYLPERHPPPPGWTTWAVAGHAYKEFGYALNQDGQVVTYGNAPADYLTDVLSRLGARFVTQSAGSPFLIEIATFAPHAPYTPAPRDAAAFPRLRAPRTPAFDAAPDAAATRWLVRHPPLTRADEARIDRDFRKRVQSVQAVDTLIGDIQTAVAAIGEADNTYFAFSSDNGYHMGEHRLMPGKMTAYDTDIRVPLVITGPGVPAGAVVEDITENIDLCPTFVEIGGASPPPAVDGRSLVPLMRGEKVADWRKAALVEHHGPHNDPSDPDAPAARSGNPPTYEAMRLRSSVYVEYVDGDREYHDLDADPFELSNRYDALPAAEKAALRALIDGLKSCHSATACAEAERKAGTATLK